MAEVGLIGVRLLAIICGRSAKSGFVEVLDHMSIYLMSRTYF
jgi:hypothetical protein